MSFVDKFKKAIDLEQKVDLDQTDEYLNKYNQKKLAKLGLAVVNLVIDSIRTGLVGKTIIDMTLDPALGSDKEIEVGTMKVGDIVKLNSMAGNSNDDDEDPGDELTGVISKANSKVISVSIDSDSSDEKVLNIYNNTGSDNSKVWIVKLTNSITYKRMTTAMNKLEELKDKPEIVQLLLGETQYSEYSNPKTLKPKDYFNDTLNDSQKAAIDFAVNKSPITIIHGPPGTGKTYTIIEIIQQLVFNKNEKVLVCGPSNISVDTILERLTPKFESGSGRKKKSNPADLIRIGHPARLLGKNIQHSLDVLSKNNDILSDIQGDIGETLKKIKKCKRRAERKELYRELKDLKKELRNREKKILRDLLVQSKVVVSTLHGSGSREMMSLYNDKIYNQENPFFGTIIIDEVSQSLEPQCWIPIINHLGAKRLIIAGDDKQLPPTIKTLDSDVKVNKKTTASLEVTLFDRLVKDLEGDKYKKLLDTQYRMNQEIMEFPSKELYDGKLKAFEENQSICLSQLPHIAADDNSDAKLIWIDTQGGEFPEQTNEDENNSKFNEYEAVVVSEHVNKLMKLGAKPSDIGVIAPYNAQVTLLKRMVPEGVEVSTVDGFQGREKEVIVMSLVRSNDNGEIGFLRDSRRMNVAMTRPKRQLFVVGDLELMSRSTNYLKHWSAYVEDTYDIRYPGMEY